MQIFAFVPFWINPLGFGDISDIQVYPQTYIKNVQKLIF